MCYLEASATFGMYDITVTVFQNMQNLCGVIPLFKEGNTARGRVNLKHSTFCLFLQ